MKSLFLLLLIVFSLALVPTSLAQPKPEILDKLQFMQDDSPQELRQTCGRAGAIRRIILTANQKSTANVFRTFPNALWCFYDDGTVYLQRINTVAMSGRWSVVNGRILIAIRYRYQLPTSGTWSNIDGHIRENQRGQLIGTFTWEAGSMSAACVNGICYGGNQYRMARFKQRF